MLLIAAFSFQDAKAETKDQQVKVTLRSIGNDFLLQLKDSTSRILPIELVEGRYAVKFERTFAFEPGLLSYSVFKTFEDFEVNDSYIVEVEECETKKLIHSFNADLKENGEEIACRGRQLPEGCYIFYFTLIENKEKEISDVNTTQSNSSIWYGVLALLVGLFLFI
ncbi:hypothetical protein N9544_07215 [Flavobacteriales bacterium]|nr:hypothetical protein [Flavobacteriales bacterium]